MNTLNQNEDNQDFDITQTRNKRDQYTIEIRKLKVEGMLKAKRIKLAKDLGKTDNTFNMRISEDISNQPFPTFTELCKLFFDAMEAKDVDKLLQIVRTIRQKLSMNENPPIDEFFESGLEPHIEKFLDPAYQEFKDLQYESLWIIANCFAGPMEYTAKVVTRDLLETLVKIIASKRAELIELTLWALANVSADLDSVRLILLDLGIVDTLFKYTRTNQIFPGEELKNIAWLISNLSIIRRDEERFRPLFPLMRSLFAQKDKEFISKMAWTYSNLTNSSDELIMKDLIDENTLKLIVHNIGSTDFTIKQPCLRAIGNLICGPSNVTKKVVEFGFLEHVEEMMDSRKPFSRRESIWAVSNVVAESVEIIDKVIETSIFIKLLNAIIMDVDQIKVEALIAFVNAINVCDFRQAKIIVRLGLSKILGQALNSENDKVVRMGLDVVEVILAKGKLIQEEEQLEINPLRVDLESEGTIHFFEKLQFHRSDEIYTKVSKMIDTYFEVQQE